MGFMNMKITSLGLLVTLFGSIATPSFAAGCQYGQTKVILPGGAGGPSLPSNDWVVMAHNNVNGSENILCTANPPAFATLSNVLSPCNNTQLHPDWKIQAYDSGSGRCKIIYLGKATARNRTRVISGPNSLPTGWKQIGFDPISGLITIEKQ